MIITLAGRPGAGKTTVARMLSKRLGIPHHSVGDFVREEAKARKIPVEGLARRAAEDPSINRAIDDRTIELSHHEPSFVMDGRLAWFFIPSSFKVFLDVKGVEAARRVRQREPRKFRTLKDALASVRSRALIERRQYLKQYGADMYDKCNYDLVIDTTSLSAAVVVQRIMDAARKHSG